MIPGERLSVSPTAGECSEPGCPQAGGIRPLPTQGVAPCSCQTLTFLLPDGRILTVCQGAGGAVAQTSQVILIAAKILGFCPEKKRGEVKGKDRSTPLRALPLAAANPLLCAPGSGHWGHKVEGPEGHPNSPLPPPPKPLTHVIL